MRNNIKRLLLERIKRVKFIKTELNQLIEKSIIQNKSIDYKERVSAKTTEILNKNNRNTKSNHRIYCMINASTKLTNKKFRLSRFSLNKLGGTGEIPGLMKRG
jgi:ribosomal protein S14